MRDRIGKRLYAPRNGAGIAEFRASETVEIDALKTEKKNVFEMAVSGRNGLAVCERTSPESSALEQRYRAFHASLNTTHRQRSI